MVVATEGTLVQAPWTALMALKFERYLWAVTIAAHTVSRWEIPAVTIELGGPNADYARKAAVRLAHSKAGVPPWRPYGRVSLRNTKAKRVVREVAS